MRGICSECGKEYELESGSKPSDFQCECGGNLFIKNKEFNSQDKSSKSSIGLKPQLIVITIVVLIFIIGFMGSIFLKDLVVTNVTAPSIGERGNQIIVPATMKNNGILSTGCFNVTYYLTPEKRNIEKIYIGKIRISELYAGEIKQQNATLTIPANVTPGTYYIRVWIDPGNEISELDDNNNVGYSSTQITIN
ncbi:CARDB domain-containing protein [Methanobacterium ferruginis]|uniref:CARDB domain-containing protein n=1 Tax=Methanobacterium ferruginis TaxID=710191 RepID=UPI00257423BD|nr:CARDB domain-containing protein [Methanobacterium ferruginis]BDZ69418.1 hypothetical protein GCM10025860_28660 [Methanobacterium ferruginis]